jgi:hypothetical protein
MVLVIYRPIANQPVHRIAPSPDYVSYRRRTIEPECDTDLSEFTVLIWIVGKSEAALSSTWLRLRCKRCLRRGVSLAQPYGIG